jgi:hypothetical protein
VSGNIETLATGCSSTSSSHVRADSDAGLPRVHVLAADVAIVHQFQRDEQILPRRHRPDEDGSVLGDLDFLRKVLTGQYLETITH